MTYQLHHGNMLDILPMMDRESIDSIVTDPPYGLSFMGKDWDHGVPGEHFWREAYRVAKPGAYLLAFGGTRTFHRLACAIEDAGWEIRDDVALLASMDDKQRAFFDSLTPNQQQVFLDTFASNKMLIWVYGQGFPKSHDVSKAIDREAGAEREVIGRSARHVSGKPEQRTDGLIGTSTFSESIGMGMYETSPATPLAAEWSGWGTALKPAWEPIIVARKPLQGTVAENVTRYGTGAMNIDACRIETSQDDPNHRSALTENLYKNNFGGGVDTREPRQHGTPQGRWPANLIHDGSAEVLAGFPNVKSCGVYRKTGDLKNTGRAMFSMGDSRTRDQMNLYGGDTGSAARFFYCAPHDKLDLLFCRAKSIIDTWIKYDVPTVENDLPLSSQRAVSVLRDAVTVVSRGDRLLSDLTGLSTTVTQSELRTLLEALTTAILSLENAPLPDLLQGAVIPNGSLVKFAEIQKQTGITTITISQWKSDGSADVATFNTTQTLKDHGAAASVNRFIYTAKASKQDRDEGCEGLEEVRRGAMDGNIDDGDFLTGSGNLRKPTGYNHHPTVKPTSLMRYLCRLVTLPNGVILDPFMGSGSTGKAAILEGFNFIGVDTEIEYVEIAARRIEHACEKVGIVVDQPMLFDTKRETVDRPKQLILL